VTSKKILITGATGFLGSHILARLVEEGFSLVVLKRSFSDTGRIEALLGHCTVYDLDRVQVKNVFEVERPDLVLHCATNYGRKTQASTEIVKANLILPLELLQLAVEYRAQAFINTDTILDPGVNDYALSKSQFREWLRSYSTRIATVNVPLEHFYGAFDDPSKFVSRVLSELLAEAPSIEFTPGEQLRDFVHVSDVVDAFAKIILFSLSARFHFHEFQVGSGHLISIRDLVHLLQEHVREIVGQNETLLKFGVLDYRPFEVMESKVNTDALRALGWTPKVPLSDGLAEMVRQEAQSFPRTNSEVIV
jgi:nucleoside-diphosphate-sugar epimerase